MFLFENNDLSLLSCAHAMYRYLRAAGGQRATARCVCDQVRKYFCDWAVHLTPLMSIATDAWRERKLGMNHEET